MATYTKVQLTGSTNGRGILVAATSSPGTAIHTAHATALDEVWLWAVNTDASARLVTVQFGGTTSPNDNFTVNLPPNGGGPVLLVPGITLTNSLLVKAFAALTNVVNVFGHVNRIG